MYKIIINIILSQQAGKIENGFSKKKKKKKGE